MDGWTEDLDATSDGGNNIRRIFTPITNTLTDDLSSSRYLRRSRSTSTSTSKRRPLREKASTAAPSPRCPSPFLAESKEKSLGVFGSPPHRSSRFFRIRIRTRRPHHNDPVRSLPRASLYNILTLVHFFPLSRCSPPPSFSYLLHYPSSCATAHHGFFSFFPFPSPLPFFFFFFFFFLNEIISRF